MSGRGARLLFAMAQRGLKKQHALAHAVGVNESTVTRWLRDGPMSLEHAVALSLILDVSLDWLLLGRGEPLDARPSREDGQRQRILITVSLLSAKAQQLLMSLIEEITVPSGG